MINVNKLFPRLSIRVKLAIAFALVALGPLAVVSFIGARETVFQIEATARNTLEHDLEMAETETALSLSSAEGHMNLIANVVLGPLLHDGAIPPRERLDAERVVKTLLASEPTLYQVKLIDADGRYRLLVRASGPSLDAEEMDGGEYYAWRASSLRPHTRLLFAIEVAGPEEPGLRKPMPAVALLFPVHAPNGEFRGAVVGEAYASALFSHLDHASAGFGGITGLVDGDGHFLYHSLRKRDWATLLAAHDRLSVRSDFPDDVASAIISGRAGTLMTPDRELVSFRPLSLGTPSGARLSLYRVVPIATVAAPARSFVLLVFLAAGLVALLVLGLAMLAANEFTKPIFRIRDAAWQLARGEPVRQPNVETNDEFEDLANDFARVAEQVARHRAQREALIAERTRLLEHTHAELADILKHSADGIIGLDPSGVVTIWNDGAERLLGYSGSEAISREINAVLRPSGERARREQAVMRRELEREHAVVNFLTEVLAKDGTPIQISLTATLIAGVDGGALGSSLIVRDNRLQSRLEDQMRRSERLAAISVMAAGLAHEINNPLAIIGNRIECMQRDVRDKWSDTPLATDLDVLQQHVARLRELTTSLLRFARDDRGEAGPVALGALAESTVALLNRTMAMRRLHLQLHVEPGVPDVIGYEKAIETVIVNLLLNAADATPPDGTVTLSTRCSADGEAVEIEVRDTGHGLAPELRERVFDPFFTTKGPGHGTGLGLTVCRSIVDRHGGVIAVDTPPDGGCRFVVTIPLQPMGATWNELAYL
ncbi:MAG: ATP-binding protein [Gemmatimonadaceae bacterium]|nr:ATP-binding protein [Gemmatimonadaceae bacterium]